MPTRTTNTAPRNHRPALSLVGMVVVLVVLATMLGPFVLINRTLRHEAAELRTRQTLLTLHAALRVYADEHDAMPAGDAAEALAGLQAHPAAAGYLDDVTMIDATDTTPLMALDGFGRPLRYQVPDATGRQPAGFVSAGLSGRFGPPPQTSDTTGDRPATRRAAADNLYSFELETHNP